MAPTSTHRTRALSRNTASAPARYGLVRADGLWWYALFAALRPRIGLEYPQTAHDGPAVVRCVWSRSIPVAARSGLHAPGGPCPLVGYRPRGEPSMLRPSRGRHRTYTPQQLSRRRSIRPAAYPSEAPACCVAVYASRVVDGTTTPDGTQVMQLTGCGPRRTILLRTPVNRAPRMTRAPWRPKAGQPGPASGWAVPATSPEAIFSMVPFSSRWKASGAKWP
jgi:hypothetical protein